MSTITFEALVAQAMHLSPEHRADLADLLMSSLHSEGEIDAAWEAEIRTRIEQIDAGEVECAPWETVSASLKTRLGK